MTGDPSLRSPVLAGETVLAGDGDGHAWVIVRRTLVAGLIAFALLQPAISLLGQPLDGRRWFLLIGDVVLTVLVCVRISSRELGIHQIPWLSLAAIIALGIALFSVGGANWIAALGVAAAVCGRYSQTPVAAVVGATACGAAGLTVSIIHGYQSGLVVAAAFIAPITCLLTYSAGRRADTLAALRRTRAELARAAVAEERLRIARDLHDLLGHSLSLITLKAELAGRVIGTDPARAAKEIAELESVARQSLSDVREAVSGFRQPDLAGELAAARQLLDAAGISCQITSDGVADLPQDVDAVLAWAVREGTTNVVRHSKASHVAIDVRTGAAVAVAEITDDGPADVAEPTAAGVPALSAGPNGRAAAIRATAPFGGSGLVGLAERVRGLGGELAAGAVEPRGFRLRVVVPLHGRP